MRETIDVQYNCSPPTDKCPSYFQAVIIPSQLTLPGLHTKHDILLYAISLWPVWSPVLAMPSHCFLCSSTLAEDETPKRSWQEKLSNSWNTNVLSLFSHWVQTTALYKLLRRKFPLCQVEPGHLGSKTARKRNSPLKTQLPKQWTGPAEVSRKHLCDEICQYKVLQQRVEM